MAGGWPAGPVQVNSEPRDVQHAGAMKSSPERGTHVHGSSAFLQALGDSATHAEPASRPPPGAGGPAGPALGAPPHAAYASHHVAPSCPDLAGAPQALQYHNPQHSASTPMLHPGQLHPHHAPPAPYTLAYTQYEQHHHGDQLYQYQAQGGMTHYAWQGYHAHGSDFMAKGGSGDGGGRSVGTSSNGSGMVSAATGNTPTVGAGAGAAGAGAGNAAAGTPFSAGRPPLPSHGSIAEAAGGSAVRGPSPAPEAGAGGPGATAWQQPGVGAAAAAGSGSGADTEMYDPLAHAMEEDQLAAAPVAAAAGGARPAAGAVQPASAAAVGAPEARREQQQQQQQLQPPEVDLIVVWDLDETLIVFNSLISGAFARAAALAASRAARAAAAAAGAAGRGSPGSGGGGHSLAAAAEAAALPRQAEVLGQRLADLVFEFCDEHMGFKSLDQLDPLSFTELWALAAASEAEAQAVADAAAEDAAAASGDVAAAAASAAAAAAAAAVAAAGPVSRATLERIAAAYGGGAAGLPALLGAEKAGVLAAALAEVESLTGGWVAAARRLLTGLNAAVEEQAARRAAATAAGEDEVAAAGPWLGITAPPPALSYRRVRHVLVSAGHLVATLGKLLMWGLDEHFDIRDVYSASGRSKLDAFRQLRAALGAHNAFAAVGDGAEEERAAGVMGWGFVRVGLAPSSSSAPNQQLQHPHHHAHAATDGTGHSDCAAAGGSAAGAAGVAGGSSGSNSSQFGYRSVSPLARSESTSPPQPWQLPRPLADIAPQEVLCAAREAYWYF